MLSLMPAEAGIQFFDCGSGSPLSRGRAEVDLMAQLGIARGLDPVLALRRGRKEDAVLAAEAALQFGAREQRGEFRLRPGGEQRETIQRTAKHAAIDQLGPGDRKNVV